MLYNMHFKQHSNGANEKKGGFLHAPLCHNKIIHHDVLHYLLQNMKIQNHFNRDTESHTVLFIYFHCYVVSQ